jgi:recombination protein RecA
MENALDTSYAKSIGVDVNAMLISQPNNGEEALDIVEEFVKSKKIDLIVIDSVAALVPKKELEGEIVDETMALQARMMSKAMRRLTHIVNKAKTAVIFINQERDKVGVMFGAKTTTPGGRALKFYSSVRIRIVRIESIMNGEAAIGNVVKAKVVKNKVAPPFREATFEIIFGKGIKRISSIFEAAESIGILKKDGTSYLFNEKKIAQGKDDVIDKMAEDKELLKKIKEATKLKYFKEDDKDEEENEKQEKSSEDGEKNFQ